MKLTILIMAVLGFMNVDSMRVPAPTGTDILSGASQKSWYMSSKTPDATPTSCTANSPQSLDNSWTFFRNGTFEFNRGAITQDSSCLEKGCCSDMLNMIGTWTFTHNESGLKIVMLHQKEKPSNVVNSVLFDATLIELTADKFSVKLTDVDGIEYAIEFKVK